MINLIVESDKIAHAIDKPFDFALKQRLISTIIDTRATMLRQTIARNKTIPSECIQSAGFKIEKVNAFSNYYNDNFKTSIKSIDTIPNPIRLDSDSPFISVTSLDGSINFTYADFATVKFNSNAGQFVSSIPRYIYHGERIGAYGNNSILLTAIILIVRGVFENPLLVKDYSGLYNYSNEHFPMPMDMMNTIRNMILSGDLKLIPSTKEITVNDNK